MTTKKKSTFAPTVMARDRTATAMCVATVVVQDPWTGQTTTMGIGTRITIPVMEIAKAETAQRANETSVVKETLAGRRPK